RAAPASSPRRRAGSPDSSGSSCTTPPREEPPTRTRPPLRASRRSTVSDRSEAMTTRHRSGATSQAFPSGSRCWPGASRRRPRRSRPERPMPAEDPQESQEGRSPAELDDPHEAEQRYRLLVEQVPAIIYMDAVDEFSTNIYTSPQIDRIPGIPREEWVTDRELWVKQMHPDDRGRVLRENDESNRTGLPFRTEYRMLTRDGHEKWFRDEAVVVRDDAGRPWFWRGVMTDITEIKRTE